MNGSAVGGRNVHSIVGNMNIEKHSYVVRGGSNTQRQAIQTPRVYIGQLAQIISMDCLTRTCFKLSDVKVSSVP